MAATSVTSSPRISPIVLVSGFRPERLPQRERREGADHEDLAVGEVDQLDDSVDERVPERDERPDRPVRQAVGEVVAEAGEVPVVDEVLNAVVGRERDQDRDQAVLRDELGDDLRRPRLQGCVRQEIPAASNVPSSVRGGDGLEARPHFRG